MYLAGFSINNLTLMGLTIATGFVVDDAIVMLENIARHMERGDTPLQAALKGAGQIGFTLISLTFSLVAVLIPLLFMGDVVGRLFHEFCHHACCRNRLITRHIADADTDDVRALPKARPRNTPRGSARRASSLNTQTGSMVLRIKRRRCSLRSARSCLRRSYILWCQRAFSPCRRRRDPSHQRSATVRCPLPPWADRQQALAHEILKEPDVVSLASFIGVDGNNPTLNSGRFSIQTEAHSERDATPLKLFVDCKSVLRMCPGNALLQPISRLEHEDKISRTRINSRNQSQ